MSDGDKPLPAQKPDAKPAAHKPAATKPAHKPTASKPAAHKPAMRRPAATQRPTDQPLLPRTATLDDPLTTSLLAEVARRSKTIEILPETLPEKPEKPEKIDQARRREPADSDPDDSI